MTMNKILYTAITIAIISLVTILLRSFAFIALPEGKEIPKVVKRLGKTLPYGIMAFLVIYCLKDTSVLTYPYALPELISVALVVLLQVWRRNSLLSILLGTVCYMVLVQMVF